MTGLENFTIEKVGEIAAIIFALAFLIKTIGNVISTNKAAKGQVERREQFQCPLQSVNQENNIKEWFVFRRDWYKFRKEFEEFLERKKP